MSESSSNKKSSKSVKNVKTFSESTQRLEGIIAQMDHPNTSLEEMISLVEEGMKLIHDSRKILAQAELRIKKLEQLPSDDAPSIAKKQPSSDANDNEFSLF